MASPYFKVGYRYSSSNMAKSFLLYIHSGGHFACDPAYNVYRLEGKFYDFQIKYVISGYGYVEYNNRTYKVCPGDIFYLDLSKTHRYYADPDNPWHLKWIHFGGIQAEGYYRWVDGLNNPIFKVQNTTVVEAYFDQILDLLQKPSLRIEARISVLISQLITEIVLKKIDHDQDQDHNLSSKKNEERFNNINKALNYIEEKYATSLIVEEIAKRVRMSPSHFSHIFRQTTGFSVMEYVFKKRLTKAKELLETTNMSIGEISAFVGYEDQSYFGKRFKNDELMSPRQYRQLYKNKEKVNL
jgi:AraC-like DNA-binding protein